MTLLDIKGKSFVDRSFVVIFQGLTFVGPQGCHMFGLLKGLPLIVCKGKSVGRAFLGHH